jgi:transposase
MVPPFRYRLSNREKDALLTEHTALIERQAARITELEALLARPEKTSRSSHTPPSQDRKPSGEGEKERAAQTPAVAPGCGTASHRCVGRDDQTDGLKNHWRTAV